MPGRPLVRARLGDRTANTHRRTPSARLDLRMAAHGELPHCWRAQPRNAPRRCTASFLAPSVYCPISGYICQVEQAQQRCAGTTAGRALAACAFSVLTTVRASRLPANTAGKVSSPLFAAHAGDPADASGRSRPGLGPSQEGGRNWFCVFVARQFLARPPVKCPPGAVRVARPTSTS